MEGLLIFWVEGSKCGWKVDTVENSMDVKITSVSRKIFIYSTLQSIKLRIMVAMYCINESIVSRGSHFVPCSHSTVKGPAMLAQMN